VLDCRDLDSVIVATRPRQVGSQRSTDELDDGSGNLLRRQWQPSPAAEMANGAQTKTQNISKSPNFTDPSSGPVLLCLGE
jgi:hypothetical protein